jgi:hypothetical protein
MQRLGRKSAEDNGVGGADSRACLHGNDALDRHGM